MNEIKQTIITSIIKSKGGLALSEMVKELGLPKTTVYRHLEGLVKTSFLYKNEKRYYLGPVVIIWSNMVDKKYSYVGLVRPFLEELSNETNEIVNLICANNFIGNYLDRLEPPQSVLVKPPVGSEVKLYASGAGRAILAEFSDEKLERYFEQEDLAKITPKTVTDKDELKKKILKYKEQGFATEVEQNTEQVHCIAVAVKLGDTMFAISITATLLTSKEKLLSYVPSLQECASKVKAFFDEGIQ